MRKLDMALPLTDAQGGKVCLGSQGTPSLLTLGQNTLACIVTPEHTKAPLQAGTSRVPLNFRLREG